MKVQLAAEGLRRADLRRLIAEHTDEMRAGSPAESVHALDLDQLRGKDVTVWTARHEGTLLACGALKELDTLTGELKSMRTAETARGQGIGRALLEHIIGEAQRRGYRTLLLETGAEEPFAPARNLYLSAGFRTCGPFGSYTEDPLSVYMALDLG